MITSNFRSSEIFSIKLFTILFFIVKLTLPFNAAAQFQGGDNFLEFMENYYNDNPVDNASDAIPRSGAQKQYDRSLEIWGERLYPHGDFSVAASAIVDYAQSYQSMSCVVDNNIIWEPIGPADTPDLAPGVSNSTNGIGQMHRITFDPNYNGSTNQRIYAASGFGGLWKTDDGGNNWSNLNTDFLPMASVSDVAIDYNNGQNIFISTGEADAGLQFGSGTNFGGSNPIYTLGMYRSMNGGASWQTINNGFLSNFSQGGTVRRLLAHPTNSNNVIAATTQGIYQTTNALDTEPTWMLTNNGLTAGLDQTRGLVFEPNNPNTLFCSTTDIYKSVDGGNNWQSITGAQVGLDIPSLPSFTVMRINLAVTPDDPNRLYAYLTGDYPAPTSDNANATKTVGYVYYYNGTSWQELYYTNPVNAFEAVSTYWMAIAANPEDADEIVFGHTRVKKFANITAGSFTNISPYSGNDFHADVHALVYEPVPGSNRLFCANHGGISIKNMDVSSTGGWVYANKGIRNEISWSGSHQKGEPKLFAIARQDCGNYMTHQSANNETRWRLIHTVGDGYGVSFPDPKAKVLFHLGSSNPNFHRYNYQSNSNISENANMPYDPYFEYINLTDYIKVGAPKTFKTQIDPISGNAVFGFTDLFERIKLIPNAGDDKDDLWVARSDIGFVQATDWKRQITDFQISVADPNYVYSVDVGDANISIPSNEDSNNTLLYRSTTGLRFDFSNPTATPTFEDITPNILNSNLAPGYTYEYPPVITGIALNPLDGTEIWLTMSNYFTDLKIIHSTDAGLTWENADPTSSLPNLPANDLVYQSGSDDRIYLATDAGVYYKDNSIDCWAKYGDIPNVRVSEIEINSCSGKVIAYTYGRGTWQADVLPADGPLPEKIVASDELWDDYNVLEQSVRIMAGATLTVTDVLKMPKYGSIYIEHGGRLIVDGGTITNSCGQLWQGIEVWGSGNENQYASGGQYQQGRAIFRNGALIENAWEGVRNHKPGQWGTSGGIIQAKNSTFKNCRRMVEFISYQNFSGTTNMPDRSYFSQCDFIKDDDFARDPNVSPPHPMITMWDVDRVRFSGCNFINNATLGNTSELQSNAILSIDASYYIQAHCSSVNPNGCPTNNLTKSRFKGWHKGIEALGSNSAKGILVRNTVFDENMIGIEINGADYSQIYKNEFNMGGHPFQSWNNFPSGDHRTHLGIYSNKTLHFAIEENFFESPLQGAPFDGHGVLVYNSLGADNQIYNNFFENLETGANGWQINLNENSNGGVPFGQSGLQFLCNINTSNEVDFEISRSGDPFTPGYTNSGIRMRQGNFNPAKSAGNTFSVPNPDPNVFSHWTVNSLHPYNYYTTTSISPEEAEIGPEEMDIEIVSAFNGCLPNYTIGAGIVKTDLLIKLTEFNGLKYTYLQTIDDGNTPGEINEIELAWPQDAWDLRDELISRSPNNSEDVLIALIRKDIMPNAMLLEVLLANPDALRSGSVIRVASTEVHPPLPQYMIDMLYASRNGTTLRTSMESALADLHMEVQRLQKRIVGQIMFADSLHAQSDSTLYYLQKVRTVEGNYSRAAALAERHMYTQANMVLDSMLVSYKLNTTRSAEVSALKDFYTFLNSAHSSGKDLANLDSSEVQSLKGIAESTTAGLAAQKAQNALCFFYAICYDAQGQPKSMGTAKKPKPTLEELVAELNQVNAYPSPSDQHVTITYSLLNARENTTLQVFDFLGREVVNHKIGRVYQGQHFIDTRKYANGLYLYQIVQDDIKTSEGKFIVTH